MNYGYFLTLFGEFLAINCCKEAATSCITVNFLRTIDLSTPSPLQVTKGVFFDLMTFFFRRQLHMAILVENQLLLCKVAKGIYLINKSLRV